MDMHMDDRPHSPTDHVLAGMELLHRLSLVDAEDLPWIQAEPPWDCKQSSDRASTLPFGFDEEADACDLAIYDPCLFSPATSPQRIAFDKPLPARPTSAYRASPPVTPRLTPASTPSSSPRASISPSHSQPLPRSRPPSTNLGTPRSMHHAAFPSISSTLSLLEERESEHAKRSGVLVDPEAEDEGRGSPDSTILVHALRKSSVESFKPKPRPTLNLSTSVSSPQLRTLADLASVPASPISISSPRSMAHKPSLISLVPSISSPLASASRLLPPTPLEEEPPASRWSMDSVDRDAGRPSVTSPAVTPPSPPPPPKTPKRSRLLSFISMTRGRAGSLGTKRGTDTVPPTPIVDADVFGSAQQAHDVGSLASSPTITPSMASSSRRASRSDSYPPPPMLSASTSTMSTISSVSTLPTPADSQPDVTLDPFCPASPTFMPASFLPDADDSCDDEDAEPPKPTLPLPSPNIPTASFFLADTQQPQSPGIPAFLSAALARRKLRRRKKKLVVTCLTPEPVLAPGASPDAAAAARERDLRRRHEGIMHWCEGVGAVRRFERKPDGSLHVYWRDWEVADMVCRVSAQVTIKGVGLVSLAWHYLN